MTFFEETLKSEKIYDGKVFGVSKDVVRLENGEEAIREVVTHNGGVGIVVLDDNKNIILVKQFRYGASTETLEIPAGKLERGEVLIECAKRELTEETGFCAEEFISLGYILPTPAYCSEKIFIFLASGLTLSQQKLDDDEFLDVISMPFDDAYNKVMSGEIVDAKTVSAILKVKQML